MSGRSVPGLTLGDFWFVCAKRDAIFRIEVTDGHVVDAALYVRRWAVGLPAWRVLMWCDRWQGPFQ